MTRGVCMYLFDLHCDTITRLHDGQRLRPGDRSLRENGAHLSLKGMSRFSWAQCFAIFIPDEKRGQAAVDYFEDCYAFFCAQLAENADLAAQARTISQAQALLDQGKTAAFLTVEGGAALGGRLEQVDRLAACGVKLLTLTWNGPNELASGNVDPEQGFTSFGREAVRRLEDRGIGVDVSHLNDKGFWELSEFARRPFVASHSNARAVCPHPRNLTDSQICRLVEVGGLVGLNYCTQFLAEGGRPTFRDLAAHIRHFLDLGAQDILALGSDYDGADVPDWLEPVEKLEPFYHRVAGEFGQAFAQKLFSQNARAFWERFETSD